MGGMFPINMLWLLILGLKHDMQQISTSNMKQASLLDNVGMAVSTLLN